MPINGHVGFAFIISIVAEEAKPPITVNWALYIEEMKKKQQSGVCFHSQKGKVVEQGSLSLFTNTGSQPPGLQLYSQLMLEIAAALLLRTIYLELGVRS